VADWVAEPTQSKDSTTERPIHLLDLCCGTGTIGIVLTALKQVKKVTGIELCADAVADARLNAASNHVEDKIDYLCGPVEDMMPVLLQSLPKDDSEAEVVGVLDPPRAGVHPSVIHAIRKCERLNRLVYISCNPDAASQNWIGLCRAESKRFHGKPFRLARAQAVDLFPHTKHCELLLEFVRDP
jgi:tRNA (uracil-5-)-methyltransferase